MYVAQQNQILSFESDVHMAACRTICEAAGARDTCTNQEARLALKKHGKRQCKA